IGGLGPTAEELRELIALSFVEDDLGLASVELEVLVEVVEVRADCSANVVLRVLDVRLLCDLTSDGIDAWQVALAERDGDFVARDPWRRRAAVVAGKSDAGRRVGLAGLAVPARAGGCKRHLGVL